MEPAPSFTGARGFTLLEVLIAVLVLALGLLGLAALQSTGLRQNHSAYLRSQATLFAYDIIDRMRGNKTAVYPAQVLVANCPIPPPASPPDCATPACEMNSWIRSLRTALPCGDAGVALVGDVVTVTVAWDDNRSGAANQQFAMSTQL